MEQLMMCISLVIFLIIKSSLDEALEERMWTVRT